MHINHNAPRTWRRPSSSWTSSSCWLNCTPRRGDVTILVRDMEALYRARGSAGTDVWSFIIAKKGLPSASSPIHRLSSAEILLVGRHSRRARSSTPRSSPSNLPRVLRCRKQRGSKKDPGPLHSEGLTSAPSDELPFRRCFRYALIVRRVYGERPSIKSTSKKSNQTNLFMS